MPNVSFLQYVLKKMNLQNASKRERKAAEQEAKLLAKLKHPNIVSYKVSTRTWAAHVSMGSFQRSVFNSLSLGRCIKSLKLNFELVFLPASVKHFLWSCTLMDDINLESTLVQVLAWGCHWRRNDCVIRKFECIYFISKSYFRIPWW